MDGTLVDTKEDITRAANAMLAHLGEKPLSVLEVCHFVGSGLRELVRRCLNSDDPERIEKGMEIYRAYYRDHLLDRARLYPYAREVLEHFKSRRQAVVTNKPNPYPRDLLAGLGVAGYFIEIVAGDSGWGRKPDPTAVLSIMQKVGVSTEGTLLVGDSPIDVQTGRNAGIFTVGVAHGFVEAAELKASSPDLMVGDLKEFLETARRLAW